MQFSQAITRRPGANYRQGITTVPLDRAPDHARILEQHAAYVKTLVGLGLRVTELAPEHDFPDAYFVEDVAVMLAGAAVLTRPGAPSRLGEVARIAPVLKAFGDLEEIREPGLLDGGDVLQAADHFFIGLSGRTNAEGARQLGEIIEKRGFSWSTVPVAAALHLKSGVNHVGDETLLVLAAYARVPAFADYSKILVSPQEAPAANTVAVNGTLLVPMGFPRTRKALEALGRPIIELDISEVIRMDGGLSCMSLRF